MEDFNEMRQRQERELLAENNPLQLYPATLDQLLAMEFPPREWLVDGLLAAQAMTLVSAAPNTFKTFLMLDMALSIAQGKKLFGELETQQANILIVDEESQDYGLYERFRKFNAPKGLPIYWLSRLRHKITDESYLDSIISRCAALDIGLVMFDSLTRMHDCEENSSKEMAKVMDAFKKLTDYGIAVLLLHHTNKGINVSPENAIRGSSEIFAAPDSHIAMRRLSPKDCIEIKQTKNRFKKPHRPFKVCLTDIENEQVIFQLQEWLPTDEDKTSELKATILRVIEQQPGIHKKLIEQETGIEERKLAALLKELLDNNKIVPGKRNRTLQPYYLNDGSVAETE
ncbi:MAG TPA: AAA family ATPase [Candidatus Saccharimonadales bacterium]|nr:AAA family ATPase [Candidatus Saccharimonadales bacterium]